MYSFTTDARLPHSRVDESRKHKKYSFTKLNEYVWTEAIKKLQQQQKKKHRNSSSLRQFSVPLAPCFKAILSLILKELISTGSVVMKTAKHCSLFLSSLIYKS